MQNSKNNNDWFDEFVEETKGPLAGYVRKIVSSPDDVQGVMQDDYLKVYVALGKASNKNQSPAALLYTTARNLAISRLRHQKDVRHSITAVSVAEELRGDRGTAEQTLCESQRLNELLLIINNLPPKCRDVFVLRWIHGLSQRAIAEQLGIAESTVEKHLAKGLRYCKNEIRHKAELADAGPEEVSDRKNVGVAS